LIERNHLQWLHLLRLNLHYPSPQPGVDHGQREMLYTVIRPHRQLTTRVYRR